MFCYENRVTVQLVSAWKIGRYPFRDMGLLSYRCGNAKKINKLEHLQLQVLGAVPIVKFGIAPKMTYWQFFYFFRSLSLAEGYALADRGSASANQVR